MPKSQEGGEHKRGMGYETPYPEPVTPHTNPSRIVSYNIVGTKFEYFLFKRCDILVS